MNELAEGARWLPAGSVVVVSDKAVGALPQGANDDYQQLGGVAKAKNGDLLVMITLANPHRIALTRSTDQGHTWSPLRVVWQFESDPELYNGFASLQVLRSGRILAVLWGYYFKGWPRQNIGTPWFTIYSDDDGATWKRSATHTDYPPFLSMCPYNQMREVDANTIILPIWGHVQRDETSQLGGTIANGFLLSRDAGLNWESGGVVMRGDRSIGTMPNEISILPLTQDKWLAMFRMNWVKPGNLEAILMFRSYSYDRGRTWSRPEQVLGGIGYVCLQKLPDGAVMVSGTGSVGSRYLVSYDEGDSWAYEQLLDSSGDAGTTSVILDHNTIFLVHGAGMGVPHGAAYWRSGLRGRWIRRQS